MKSLFLWLGKTLLALLVLIVVVFTAGVLWPLPVPQPAPRPAETLVTNIQLVDVRTGQVVPNQQILVRNGRIVRVGDRLENREGVRVDGGGRYVIPGLFDMHVHSFKMAPTLTHPLFVAAGVTHVRDMGGCMDLPDAWVACAEEKRRWHEAVDRGEMIGPRYDRVTSLAMNGGAEIPGALDPALGGATQAGIEARVASDHARGLDFFKAYTMLPREGFLSLARLAEERGMYVAGHLPLQVSALEAISAGQRSFEHAMLFIFECYPGMDELRRVVSLREIYNDDMRQRMIRAHDSERCTQLHQRMAAAGAAFVPTHTTRKLDAFAADEAFRSDQRLRYVPAPLRTLWRNDADGMAALTRDGNTSYREFYEFGLEQTGIAHAAGVLVLAGSDAPDSFVFPGSGLHDELEHLVTAGLSPPEALRAATIDAAAFLGLEGQAGELIAGARADLVLLERNPLDDISAVREIYGVMLAGTFYGRRDLDVWLEQVERASGSWTMWPKFAWQIARSPIMLKQFAD